MVHLILSPYWAEDPHFLLFPTLSYFVRSKMLIIRWIILYITNEEKTLQSIRWTSILREIQIFILKCKAKSNMCQWNSITVASHNTYPIMGT